MKLTQLKTGNLEALGQTTRWQHLFARSDALWKPSAARAFMRMGHIRRIVHASLNSRHHFRSW
jgi:hypothetical protein